MRFYTYISQTKVEMLYSQVESRGSELERSAAFDIKVLKVERKERQKEGLSIHAKIEAIEATLAAQGLIGTPEENRPYIAGTLSMHSGGYGWSLNDTPSPIAFWGRGRDGETAGMALALAGSRHHLLGEQRGTGASSHSLTDAMTSWFLKNLGESFTVEEEERLDRDPELADRLTSYDVANGAFLAATQMGGLVQEFSFLAKVLHRSEWHEEGGFRHSGLTRILLGTPIWVAMAD